MKFARGAIISIMTCSEGFQDFLRPKLDESKKRAKNKKSTHTQIALILLTDINDYISPEETLLFYHYLSKYGHIVQCFSGTKNYRGERIFRDGDWKFGFLPQQDVQIFEQGAASG